jgi:hypothetical protein
LFYSTAQPTVIAPSTLIKSAEEGTPYFIDPDTNVAVWEKPSSLQWTSAVDEKTGNVFYVNEVTKATQWEKPAHLAWVQVESDKSEL